MTKKRKLRKTSGSCEKGNLKAYESVPSKGRAWGSESGTRTNKRLVKSTPPKKAKKNKRKSGNHGNPRFL